MSRRIRMRIIKQSKNALCFAISQNYEQIAEICYKSLERFLTGNYDVFCVGYDLTENFKSKFPWITFLDSHVFDDIVSKLDRNKSPREWIQDIGGKA